MIGVIFNHNMFDDPYKQTAVNKGFDKLEALCDKLNERLCTSYLGGNRSCTDSIFGCDLTDDYIIVHYTADLSDETKAEIANCIKEILTLKKTEFKNELPEIHIIFTKVAPNDYYCFNVEE